MEIERKNEGKRGRKEERKKEGKKERKKISYLQTDYGLFYWARQLKVTDDISQKSITCSNENVKRGQNSLQNDKIKQVNKALLLTEFKFLLKTYNIVYPSFT